jgi:hypothetical protein
MKHHLLLFLALMLSVTAAAQRMRPQPKPTPETLVTEGDAAFLDYRFEQAANLYTQAQEAGCTDCNLKIRKAEKASTMLTAVQHIEVIDTLIVPKQDFLTHYSLPPDAGKVYQTGITADSLPLTAFLPERQHYCLTTDTVGSQTDLFIANRLLTGWTDKQPLSTTINTAANENFPFMMPDGITLYFGADGENSIGGYDIFVSRFSSESNDFMLSENAGMPFNSPFNDYLLAIDEANGTGCFASDRFQEKGKVIIVFFKLNKDKNAKIKDEIERVERAKSIKKDKN